MASSLLFFHPNPLLPTPKRPKYPSPKPLLSFPLPKTPLPFLSPPNPPLRHSIKHLPYATSQTPPLPSLTPISITKLSLALTLTLSLAKLLLNPFFYTYLSLSFPFYPYFLSLLLALLGLSSLYNHIKNKSTLIDQAIMITSSLTWLTLVPAGHANGYLEGWPVAFFFIYHYFLLFEPSVRARLYGDLVPRTTPPALPGVTTGSQMVFLVSILVSHFLAAFEGPGLHLVPGGWANVPVLALVFFTLFARYHSVLYLARYSEKTAVPMAVVQFGPYRWVRHPVYATNILLIASYFCALRAPLSLGMVVAVCLWYYGGKAEAEEKAMREEFGEIYEEYANKVRYRLVPLVY